MKKLTSSQIRRMYLDFFAAKGHMIEPSASLVPHEDPTLLWINSGVAALKKYFDGSEVPNAPRITNAQKSIRTNDIENVGLTARHHTFFEMLGNFSIGDYFRQDAVKWAWELLTSPEWYAFDKDLLYVTIHPADEETYALWLELGVDPSHIVRLEDNFWEIGEGPCGPNTEIFYDRGPAYTFDTPTEEMYPGGENERYLEVWNVVFSQFNSTPGLERSQYPELPAKNIDTGMGLERMASIIQDVPTNYDTDLFMPIIHHVEKISGQKYHVDATTDIAFKIIADHIRTVTFAVADGALPSNEGRGYILRRLIRRAVRWAKKLGLEKPFMAQLVPTVADVMADYYPYVTEHIPFIQKVITNEEERFLETLNDGLAILATFMETASNQTIQGTDAFKLYDTYGFPIELTQEYAADHNFTVDLAGFEAEMEAQRTRARNAREDMDSMQAQNPVLRNFTAPTTFVGYDGLSGEGEVLLMLQNGEAVNRVLAGETAQIILSQTSFYAESGGQVGDTGQVTSATMKARVLDTKKAPNGQPLHTIEVIDGTLELHEQVTTTVETQTRLATIKNHTATHLLHKALKEVLGTHVNQAGSLVKPEMMRFDFTHIASLSAEELVEVELKVNQAIWQALPMHIAEMPIAQAKEVGAMALFGEKYGDVVRVVRAGEYSVELCGGCHVTNTAEIGMFKIISESGIGSGVRRIEAVTGAGAYTYTQEQAKKLQTVAQLVKVNHVDQISQRVQQLLQETKETARELEGLKAKFAQAEAAQLISQVETVNGFEVLAVQLSGLEMSELRELVDRFKEQLTTGVVVLLSDYEGRVNICAGATKTAVANGAHAGQLIKEVATICGGKGGGRPDMAQAGAKDAQAITEAIAYVHTYVTGLAK